MEIVFICQYLAKGGAERVLSILINYFSRYYKVTVYLLYDKELDYDISGEVEICKCNWKKDTSLVKRIKDITQIRKRTKGKIVIAFLYSAIRVAVFCTLLNNSILVVSERNDPNNDPTGTIKRKIRDILYYFADVIVFQTKDQMDYFSRSIRKKGIIIENPVSDIKGLKPIVTKQKRIISVCRYDKQKNIMMGIDAFKIVSEEFPDYIYEIYGKGELENELNEYIISCGMTEKVFLRGYSKTILEDIANATMYISSSDYEGISNSMLEAMALGLPVICTDCPIGGAKQIIKNGINGLLVPVGDVYGLAMSMKRVIKDTELANNLGKNACEVKNAYSVDFICSKWQKLISEAGK